MKVAIIPARGGSKRIPRKNIKHFGGKPMIAWSIEAAQKSGCFDHIVVSTDDEEIASISRELGAEIPFIRPPELANDFTGTTPVIAHAANMLTQMGCPVELICCIYATAPFLQAEDLQTGLQSLLDSDSEYAFSATSYAFPIQRAIRRLSNGRVDMLNPELFLKRSQDLEEMFHDAGQFYWGRTRSWIKEIPIFSPVSCPVILPRWRVQDIDTYEDWDRAEKILISCQSN